MLSYSIEADNFYKFQIYCMGNETKNHRNITVN